MKTITIRDNQHALVLSLPDLRYLLEAYTADYKYRGSRWLKVLSKIEKTVCEAGANNADAES